MSEEKKQGKLASEFARLQSLVSALPEEQQKQLLTCYQNDSLLGDLRVFEGESLSSEQVENLIKLETGQAYPVYVQKFSGERIELVVSPQSKLKDLKAALQVAIERTVPEHVSWRISWKKGVWRKYCLEHDGVRLLDQDATLASCGIKKNSLIRFAKLKKPK